jgi:PAS domain S-box-containing protein
MQPQHAFELVILSILIACLASYSALFLAGHVARTKARFGWLLGGAVAMGIGIWSMHFIAMLAYRLPVRVGYDVPLVLLSLLIAVVASALGLAVAGQPRPRAVHILFTGPAMGIAIAGMHYTGMAALRLPAHAFYDRPLVIASVVIAVAASYAAIALFLRFRFDRSRRGRWLKIGSALVMGHAVAGMHYTAMAAVHFEHAPLPAAGMVMPPVQLATIIAGATVVLLALVMSGAMLDRWADTVRQVRRSEERFRVMVNAIEDYAIFTVDSQGRIDSWNRGAERLLGYASSEVLGGTLQVLFPTDQQDIEQELHLAATSGQHQGDAVRVSKDGKILHVNVTTSAMRDADGNLLGFVRVMRDITERVRTQEELARRDSDLRQAQKMEAVGQLAGGVAHDFNNMLTAIRGYADLVRDEFATSPSARTAFDEIGRAVDRAASLTRQLLAFSRKQVLQPQPLDPNAAVRDIESMLRRLLVGDVELATDLAADAGQITVDPAQLHQVLLNLALNARDAMPGGGRLLIRTRAVELDAAFCDENRGAVRGPHVMLSVSDNGAGMDPEVLAHIFEPFYTTKELGMGTGLGLSTVYGIVKQSGGYIRVESIPGQGSTFLIYFPRSSAPCPANRPREKAVPARSSTATILLADDEDAIRRVLATMLERNGFKVLTARDGAEALKVGEQHAGQIDLLVTDMMMPKMHGRELSRRLFSSRPDMRVLFMSGYADNDIIERGLLDQRMSFIQKPFESSDLVAKVRATLAERPALV